MGNSSCLRCKPALLYEEQRCRKPWEGGEELRRQPRATDPLRQGQGWLLSPRNPRGWAQQVGASPGCVCVGGHQSPPKVTLCRRHVCTVPLSQPATTSRPGWRRDESSRAFCIGLVHANPQPQSLARLQARFPPSEGEPCSFVALARFASPLSPRNEAMAKLRQGSDLMAGRKKDQ